MKLHRGVCLDWVPLLDGPFRVVKTGVGEGALTIIGDAPKDFVVLRSGLRFIAKQPRREGPIECVTETAPGVGAAARCGDE